MTNEAGTYVPRREEEAAVRRQVEEVRADGTSRAVLLHGPGGAGKTMLVRNLARAGGGRTATGLGGSNPSTSTTRSSGCCPTWRPPSPTSSGASTSRPTSSTSTGSRGSPTEHVSYETVLTQLGRINRTFVDCYRTFVRTSKTTVVLTLDTIEAIRSMYLLLTLTQWMKELPHTLFILVRHGRRASTNPAIRSATSWTIRTGRWSTSRCRCGASPTTRPAGSSKPAGCTSRCPTSNAPGSSTSPSRQPLWLALATEYLQEADPPPEMTSGAAPTEATRELFRRKLVTLYRSTDFWPEAIKRLAVVRHSVTQRVWAELMADRGLPADAGDWDAGVGQLLLRRPWVRARANKRYVTLHDALAEELAKRVIPLARPGRRVAQRAVAPGEERSTPGSRRSRTNGSSPDSPGSGTALESAGTGGRGPGGRGLARSTPRSASSTSC